MWAEWFPSVTLSQCGDAESIQSDTSLDTEIAKIVSCHKDQRQLVDLKRAPCTLYPYGVCSLKKTKMHIHSTHP